MLLQATHDVSLKSAQASSGRGGGEDSFNRAPDLHVLWMFVESLYVCGAANACIIC